ncbi:MAG: AAA domain-containing protein [Candidatus Bathyarchaeota archaeon]|nr:AAA domain-containing protein [Candidatus Termiticorpusculum sp.]
MLISLAIDEWVIVVSKDKVQIIVKGEDKTDSIHAWSESGGKISITYSNGKTYSYNANNVQIKRSTLSNVTTLSCFEYLKRIAQTVGLHDSRIGNILANRYEKIDFISEESMFFAFLTGELRTVKQVNTAITVYPFGFNMSQKAAVDNALTNPLTIIEGPPGTGKTQTILNIIANAVMRGESVAVVSSNNSATANVLEKLKKYQVDFIAAYLGNSDNKREFIKSQKPLPDLTAWELQPKNKISISQSLQNLDTTLSTMLEKKNELSRIRQKLAALEIEFKHFCEYYAYKDTRSSLYLKSTTTATAALELWLVCEKYVERDKMPGFFERLSNRFLRGVINKKFYSADPNMMIAICQKRWYTAQIAELTTNVSLLQTELECFDFNTKMNEYSALSAQLFRDKLAEKYKNIKRQQFELDDLWKNSVALIYEYPVILSTTYSLRSSLSHKVMYDYVIIDESSQVDIATGALALSCARKAVIVGDLKQLPNVVDSKTAQKTDKVFAEFDLPEVYRYKNHSLLLAILEIFPSVPRTLLREHYRCHPKIIEFCNQKFYNNQLIVLTEPKSSRQPLIVYKTKPGNHAREHVNQRQIDMIKNEIIPQQNLATGTASVGIVTPYRSQTNALQEAFIGTSIHADTVDKFQGRENDVIILSTVDNQISEFTDNANRLNVAVSRAIEQLIVVINSDDDAPDTNISDLVRYVEYNNFAVIQSTIYSVFDYLYAGYREKRNELLRAQGRISEYDSENLMYGMIRNVLSKEQFMKFDVAVHVPLKMLLRDTAKLDVNEKQYTQSILSHVDFLIFDKLGKVPRLVVEVDGTEFHAEGTRQAERDKLKNTILEKYGLPYVRFKTDGSGEQEQLVAALNNVMGMV